MRPQVRAVLILTLALALWALAEGARCLATGAYFGRRLARAELGAHPNALQLPDGTFIDYGPWAAQIVRLGLDPHALAPVFVVLGLLGLVGLVLFLQARPMGWAMLVAFALASTLKFDLSALVAVVLLVVMWLPATRALLETTVRVAAPGSGNDPQAP